MGYQSTLRDRTLGFFDADNCILGSKRTFAVEKEHHSREATHRFRTSNNAKSNPEIKGRNSILFRHDALQVSDHALFTSTPHVFLLNIFINKTERSIHFY